MSSVAAALRAHAPRYLAGLSDSKANIGVRKTLEVIMRCRTGALGGVQWQCDGCGRAHWAGRSCGNRHCSTCGAEKTSEWLAKQAGKLLTGVHHFMVTFTIPQEMRAVVKVHRRAGYEAMFAAASAALTDVGSATKSLRGCKLGFFGVLHTWGRDPLVYHPHLHFVVPGGGVEVDDAGQATGWKQTPRNFFVHHGTLIKVYKAKLADAFRERDLYDQVPRDAWDKKFVVDIRAVEDGRSVVAYLAPYVHRVAISDHRIKEVDDEKVSYLYKPSKSNLMKLRTVSGQDFVAGFAQHILPSSFQKIRHYGWMSSNSRIKLEEVRIIVWMLLGWVYWLASGHASRAKPAKQPTLRCTTCGGTLQVRSITYTAMEIDSNSNGLAYLDSS